MLSFLLQEASSSAAGDDTLFPITSEDTAQHSNEGATVYSEKPSTSAATAAATEGLVLCV